MQGSANRQAGRSVTEPRPQPRAVRPLYCACVHTAPVPRVPCRRTHPSTCLPHQVDADVMIMEAAQYDDEQRAVTFVINDLQRRLAGILGQVGGRPRCDGRRGGCVGFDGWDATGCIVRAWRAPLEARSVNPLGFSLPDWQVIEGCDSIDDVAHALESFEGLLDIPVLASEMEAKCGNMVRCRGTGCAGGLPGVSREGQTGVGRVSTSMSWRMGWTGVNWEATPGPAVCLSKMGANVEPRRYRLRASGRR